MYNRNREDVVLSRSSVHNELHRSRDYPADISLGRGRAGLAGCRFENVCRPRIACAPIQVMVVLPAVYIISQPSSDMVYQMEGGCVVFVSAEAEHSAAIVLSAAEDMGGLIVYDEAPVIHLDMQYVLCLFGGAAALD